MILLGFSIGWWVVLGNIALGVSAVGSAVACGGCLWLRQHHKSQWAHVLFFIAITAVLVVVSYELGRDASLYVMFIAVGVSPAVVVNVRQRMVVTASSVAIFLAFLCTEWVLFFYSTNGVMVASSGWPLGSYAVVSVIGLCLAMGQSFLHQRLADLTQLTRMTNERDALNMLLLGAKNDLKPHQDATAGISNNHDSTSSVHDSLQGIQHALRMVQDTADIGLGPNANQAEALQIIHANVQRITQATQWVGEPPAEPSSLHGCCRINILDLVRNGCDLCNAHCLKAGIQIMVLHNDLADPMVMGDPHRLDLALMQVIIIAVNSMHHTKGQIKIELKSDTMTFENKCVPAILVSVSCNPHVSNEESMPQAMPLSFSQDIGSPSMASNLSIVKRIIRQHHGEMTVVDTNPEGIRIDLSIPCQLQYLAHQSYQAPHVPLFELDDAFFEPTSCP